MHQSEADLFGARRTVSGEMAQIDPDCFLHICTYFMHIEEKVDFYTISH